MGERITCVCAGSPTEVIEISKERCQEWNGSSQQWLKARAETEAARAHTSQRDGNYPACPAPLAFPRKSNTETALQLILSPCPGKTKIGNDKEKRKWREGQRSCIKTSALERMTKFEKQWFRVTGIAGEQCSWHELIISESTKHFSLLLEL